MPDTDAREPRKIPNELRSVRETAAKDLASKIPGLQVEFDEITGGPKHLLASGRFLSDAVADLDEAAGLEPFAEIVGKYVDANEALFGHDSTELRTGRARVSRYDVAAHNGLRTVVWQQELDGIPFFQVQLRANLTRRGELVAMGGNFLSDPERAVGLDPQQRAQRIAAPPVPAERAIQFAAAEIDADVEETAVKASGETEGAERRRDYQAPGLSDTRAGLAWVATGPETARLAWDVTLMGIDLGEMYRVLVDAETGEVIVRQGLTNYISNATYRVFAKNTNLQPHDSPTPMSPGHATPQTTQPPEVARQLITLSALNTTASPNGWINDGDTQTLGNNVDAHTDFDASPNSPDLPRPSSATRTFDFPIDFTSAPSAYKDASVTQLFYLNNWMHDRLYELGFTESSGNFQTNNFGRGGNGNDAVQADAQDGSGTNNANFSTPSDGSPGRMQMYVFTGPNPDIDGDFDAEIVIHEYCHGLSNRLVGGGSGISASQTRAMGEGWSDFYGLALLSEPGDDIHANYAAGGYATRLFSSLTQNYYFGIRRYPYSTNLLINPLTFKDIDPTQASAHTGIARSPVIGNTADEVHNAGEVWCAALWDMRANLITRHGYATGNTLALQITTDGMKLCPVNPNFLQSRDAILQADLVNNGGANRNDLWAAFAKRGMGASATSPSSSTSTGLVESFDIPDSLGVGPVATWAVTTTTGNPVTTTRVYTLINSSASPLNWTAAKTQPWLTISAASGTLAAGASTTVTASIDNSARGLAAGAYQDVITFTNVTSGIYQMRAVTLDIEPITQLIASETWEGGSAGPAWSITGTSTHRSLVTTANTPHGGSYHLTMDSSTDSTYARNEATWTVNLAGRTRVGLRFWVKMFNDESNGPPTTPFTTGADFDGVAISADGTTWYEVQPLRTLVPTWTRYSIDLDAAIAAHGLAYGPNFKIRFNHYDNFGITTDGFAFDDIELVEVINNRITLTAPDGVNEDTGTVTATLTLAPAPATNLNVTLSSSKPAEATVPASVTILAGQVSTQIPITIVDDTLLDGTQTAALSASADGYAPGGANLHVHDNESAVLSLNLPTATAEGVPDVTGVVSIDRMADTDIEVHLESDEPADLQVPSSVTISAGQTSSVIHLTPVNDNRIDGIITANITARVTNWQVAQAAIDIADDESSALTLQLPAAVREGDTSVSGTVMLSGYLPGALSVSLISSNPAEFSVPASVTIPEGKTSASFQCTIVDDGNADGSQDITVSATAAGLQNGSALISVRDNDAHHFTFAPLSGTRIPNAPFPVSIEARDVNEAVITNYNTAIPISAAGSAGAIGVSPATITGWTNGIWTGNVSINSAGTNVVLTVSDGNGHSGSSAAFDVVTGPLDHFEWSFDPSPKTRDRYFPATLTARDAGGNLTSNFDGTAVLKAIPAGSDLLDVGTGSASSSVPMYASYQDARTQVIYPAGDLGGAGRINGLALNVVTLPGQILNAWTIRMKHTSMANYNTSGQWEGSGWTTVFQSNQSISATGWQTFTFTTPFDYDGTSNLLVDFSFNNSSSSTSGYVATTSAATTRTAYYYANGTYGDPLTWSGTTPSPYTTSSVPNLRLIRKATFTAVPIHPETTASFSNGAWTGNIAVPFSGQGVTLLADDGSGHTGTSAGFNVNEPQLPPSNNGVILDEPFESATLGSHWSVTGTNTYRTQLSTANIPHGGTKHLTMDSTTGGTYARNEATLNLNLAGRSGVVLSFWAKGFGEDPHGPPPSPFIGGYDFDGVAISADGTNWYEVQGLRSLSSTYTQFTVDLDAAIASRGLSYTPAFKIRFNQYDNYAIPTDGISIDDIRIAANAPPGVAISLPTQVMENVATLSGSITLPSAAPGDTTVSLTSNAEARLTVPVEIIIPAGQITAGFQMTIIDNTLMDGNRDVSITASTSGGSPNSAGITVIDDEFTVLTLSAPATVTEGTTTVVSATATLATPPSGTIRFNLASSDTSEITVPPTLSFSAGQTSVSFPITVVNDTLIDGPQSVTITLSANGWTTASQTLTVEDNESANLALTLTSSMTEGGTYSGSVTTSGTMPSALNVSLVSSLPLRLTLPASVTIPAGSTSASFLVSCIDDSIANEALPAVITASAAGFTSGSKNFVLNDNDPHHFAISSIAGPKSTGIPFGITITAQDINNVTLPGFSGTAALSAAGDGGVISMSPSSTGGFSAGVWTGSITCNSAATNARITATSGAATGSSNPFDLALPPSITVNPASISLSVDQGTSATRTFTIGNGGAIPLVWNLVHQAAWMDAEEHPLPAQSQTSAKSGSLETSAALALADVLTNLNLNHATIRNIIPNRYAFSEGVTGTYINDGGNDMYDAGNYLGTNLGTYLTYSDNSITASSLLGTGGSYFTRKFDGLWVFVADVNALSYFDITGGLGADGSGSTDSTILTTTRGDTTFHGFVKRVYGAGDPSVNHLIIVQDGGSVTHTPSTDTNSDSHRLGNLSGVTRIYYALFAGTGGAFIDNTSMLAIMNAFLNAAGTSPFITASPASGSVNGGDTQSVTLTIDSTGLDKGLHQQNILIQSNDPANPQVILPVNLTVMAPAQLVVTPDTGHTPTGWRGGPFDPASKDFTLTNSGSHPLEWSASKTATWLNLSSSGGTIPPGGSTTVTSTLDSSAAGLPSGIYPDTLTFVNLTNGAGNATRSITLTANPFGELVVSPTEGIAASGFHGEPILPSQKTVTLSNIGDAAVDWDATSSAPWLQISNTSDTVEPGASMDVITSINATGIPPGFHTGTAKFTNSTDGRGSTIIQHSLNIALRAPLLVSEPIISSGTNNTIAWSPVSGANKYEAQASNDEDFTVPLTSGAINPTNFTFNGLGDGHPYFYRTRARYNTSGTLAAWSQSNQADFDTGILNNVNTTTVPGSVVLSKNGINVTENFDSPDTTWSRTIFSNTSTGTFTRSALSGVGPLTTPALPVNQGGDFEASIQGTRPSALMGNSPANNFTNGSIEAWIAPGGRTSLHYSGLLLRATKTTALNGYGAIFIFFTDGTVNADFTRIISGSDNGTSNWFYSNTTAFSLGANENIHAIFSIAGNTLTLRLWRVSVSGGVVTETPIPFYQGGNTLTRTDSTYTGPGLAGLYDSFSSVYPSLFDDVTVTSTDSGGYAASGTYLSPVISPVPFQNWRTLNLTKNSAPSGTSITVDVLDADNNLLAANLSNGIDLNAIPAVASQTAIRLRANLTTTISSYTPSLDDWSVSWKATPDTEVLSQWSATTFSLQDASPPVVTIATPRVTSNATVSISGSAADSTGVTSLTVNGTPANTSNDYQNWQSPVIPLSPGWNHFMIAASDMATPPNVSLVPHDIYQITTGSDADNDGLPDAWENTHGLDLFSATGNSGALGDGDHDGICNLLELAFGMDPARPDANKAPKVTIETNPADGLDYLTVSHRRLINPGNLVYQIEVSNDCSAWTSESSRFEQIGAPAGTRDGMTEIITVRVKPAINSAGHPGAYVRVKVSAP